MHNWSYELHSNLHTKNPFVKYNNFKSWAYQNQTAFQSFLNMQIIYTHYIRSRIQVQFNISSV